MWLSIVSLAPHYPGNSRVLAGTYPAYSQFIVSPQTRNLPRAYAGRYFLQKVQKSALGWSHMQIYSDQRCPGLWGGDLPGDLQEKCPLQSRAVPGAVPWTSQSTKLNPRASPRYPQVVEGGSRVTIDNCIIYPTI